MKAYYERNRIKLFQGDCRVVLAELPANSFDRCITDPPYELGFMGKLWDSTGVAFQPETWKAVLRVLKPGAMLLAFGGSRTHHRLCCAIEDAGFEIRDAIVWLFGSGFPKSHNFNAKLNDSHPVDARCACALDSTKTVLSSQGDYQGCRGFGGGLLPLELGIDQDFAPSQTDAHERIRDDQHADAVEEAEANTSLDEGTDHPSSVSFLGQASHQSLGFQDLGNTPCDTPASKLPASQMEPRKKGNRKSDKLHSASGSPSSSSASSSGVDPNIPRCGKCGKPLVPDFSGYGTALKPAYEIIILAMKPLDGTFAANAVKHGVAGLNIDGGRIGSTREVPASLSKSKSKNTFGDYGSGHVGELDPNMGRWPANVLLDEESAALLDQQTGVSESRIGKPRSSQAPGEGWGMTATGAEYADIGGASRFFYTAKASSSERGKSNTHSTVKPLALMKYLLTLTETPTGGNVLDCFAGSGTTLRAAQELGFEAVGIELDEVHCKIIVDRIPRQEILFA